MMDIFCRPQANRKREKSWPFFLPRIPSLWPIYFFKIFDPWTLRFHIFLHFIRPCKNFKFFFVSQSKKLKKNLHIFLSNSLSFFLKETVSNFWKSKKAFKTSRTQAFERKFENYVQHFSGLLKPNFSFQKVKKILAKGHPFCLKNHKKVATSWLFSNSFSHFARSVSLRWEKFR